MNDEAGPWIAAWKPCTRFVGSTRFLYRAGRKKVLSVSDQSDISMNGYYQLIEGHAGGFMFALRAGNHETILESRVYWSRQATLDAIETLRRSSQNLHNFIRHETSEGVHFFEVRDGQQQMLARSPGCHSRSGLSAGIASVQRNAPSESFRGLVRRALSMG